MQISPNTLYFLRIAIDFNYWENDFRGIPYLESNLFINYSLSRNREKIRFSVRLRTLHSVSVMASGEKHW